MNINLNDEKGFTLLEAMIVLMLTSSILLLLTGSLLQANSINQKMVSDAQFYPETQNTVSGDRQIEWHIFLNQLENYLQGTFNPKVSRSYLEVSENDESLDRPKQVIYKQPDSGNRRTLLQYKNNGNVRMLTSIEKPGFSKDGGWLILNFKFRNGETYTGRIWVDSWIEETENG